MSLAIESWKNFASSLWQREAITKLDEYEKSLATVESAQDQAFVNHITPETEADPHRQYVLKTIAAQVFQAIGYGGIRYTAPAPITLTAGWTTMADWGAGVVTAPVEVEQDFLNNGLIVTFPGIWSLNLIINLEHDEAQGGRTLGLRLYDATADQVFFSYNAPVGRNQSGTAISIPAIVESQDTGNLVQVQLSALSDTFTAVTVNQAQFSVSLNSAYLGALLD